MPITRKRKLISDFNSDLNSNDENISTTNHSSIHPNNKIDSSDSVVLPPNKRKLNNKIDSSDSVVIQLNKRKLNNKIDSSDSVVLRQNKRKLNSNMKSIDSLVSVVLRQNKRKLNSNTKSIDSSDSIVTANKSIVSNKSIADSKLTNNLVDKLYDKKSSDAITLIVDQLFDNNKSVRLQTTNILHVLFQVLIKVSGCEAVLSAKNAISDDYESLFDEIGGRFPADIGHLYPIVNNDKKYKYFKENLNRFVIIFCKKCESSRLIFNYDFMYYLVSFINCMSNSNIRTFRHTGTFFGMKMFTCIGVLMSEYDSSISLSTKNDKNTNERKTFNDIIDRLFAGIFVQRSRDIIADIRSLCVYQLGVCINKNKKHFFNSNYLKYIGMALFDKTASVRINAVVVIKSLMVDYPYEQYDDNNNVINIENNNENNNENNKSCMRIFITRFQSRLITLICDSNTNIALAALELMCHLIENGLIKIQMHKNVNIVEIHKNDSIVDLNKEDSIVESKKDDNKVELKREDNIINDSLTQLLLNLPNLKYRHKFDKNLQKLVYLIVINYTLNEQTQTSESSENCRQQIASFSIENHKDVILQNIAMFCATTANIKNQLNLTLMEQCLNLIFSSDFGAIVTSIDSIVNAIVESSNMEIMYLYMLSYNISNYEQQLNTLSELLDVYMKNILQKFQTEPSHMEIILDIIKVAVDNYAALIANVQNSNENSTIVANRQLHKNLFQKVCNMLRDTLHLISTDKLSNYNKVVEIFQLIDEKFAPLFNENLGLSTVQLEFDHIDQILVENFNEFELSLECDQIDCFNESTKNYLLKYNSLLQGFSPYMLQKAKNDLKSKLKYGDRYSVDSFLRILNTILVQNKQSLSLLTPKINQEIISALFTNILLCIMWALLNESNFETNSFSVKSIKVDIQNQTIDNHIDNENEKCEVDTRKLVDSFSDFVTCLWANDDKSCRHNYLYHDIFKLVRDLCLLLRVFDSYSTSHHHFFTLQKNYISELIKESNVNDDVENLKNIEANFKGFIEYINYSLLDCNELAELFFAMLDNKHDMDMTPKYILIMEQILTAFMEKNMDQYFHRIVPGILKAMYNRCMNFDTTLTDEISSHSLTHIQKTSGILSGVIPTSEIKSDVYRKHMKLFICESIDYSLSEDSNKQHPTISFLLCFTPFLLKTVDVDRLGKYGLLNYFNEKLKKSNYNKKRCPIVSKFRAALKDLKISLPTLTKSTINTSANSSLNSNEECIEDLSHFLNSVTHRGDCSNLVFHLNDSVNSDANSDQQPECNSENDIIIEN